MSNDNHQAGVDACKAWMTSPAYAQYERSQSAEQVMQLFLPPIQNDMMQMSRPLPKDRREWIEGFNEEVKKWR